MIRKLALPVLALAIICAPFFSNSANAALVWSNYKNKLIDDSLFIDHDSMTIAQIQDFLEDQGSLLATWKDDVDMPRSSGSCIVHKATGKSAARIIWEAANDWHAQYIEGCGTPKYYKDRNLKTISPKVLLVTLQKEQSLITSGGTYSKSKTAYYNPSCCNNQYKLAWAMGYGVPDTGGKNHTKKGFYNQIMYAAWSLRYNYERSGGNVDWEVYDDDNEVGYWIYSGPMTKGYHKRCKFGCSTFYFDGYYPIDGKSLYMGNQATAALYYYTPHTYPGYYGNYNFVSYYEDWFGPVHLPTYKARLYGRSGGFGIKPGQKKRVFLAYRNVGTGTWYDADGNPEGVAPTVLAATNDLYRHSKFNGQFERSDRPNVAYTIVYNSNGTTPSINQSRVLPTQIVKFVFDIVAPMDIGGSRTYNEWFEPVKQAKRTMSAETLINVTVPKLERTSTVISKSGLRGARPGRELSTYVKIKNTGNVTWYDKFAAQEGVEPLVLSTANPTGRVSRWGANYELNNRPTSVLNKVLAPGGNLALNQHTVRPGETAVFKFTMTVPNIKPGLYNEWVSLRFSGAPSLVTGADIPLSIKVLE